MLDPQNRVFCKNLHRIAHANNYFQIFCSSDVNIVSTVCVHSTAPAGFLTDIMHVLNLLT